MHNKDFSNVFNALKCFRSLGHANSYYSINILKICHIEYFSKLLIRMVIICDKVEDTISIFMCEGYDGLLFIS